MLDASRAELAEARRPWCIDGWTASVHDGPIFPDLAKDLAPTGPDQLWVANLTYIRILSGFVYLAVVLDAWSRRVVAWALGRRIDLAEHMARMASSIAGEGASMPRAWPRPRCERNGSRRLWRTPGRGVSGV